jgi:transcription initiation factor TFIIB
MQVLNKIPRKERESDCCSSPALSEDNGFMVCINCGVVFEQVFDNSPRRAFTADEITNRKSAEPVYSPIGPRTVIRGNTDSKGSLLNSQEQMKFNRLGKIQRSLTSSFERNLWIALPNFQRIQERLGIPETVVKDAIRIYQLAVKEKLTMGRSIDILMAASIFASFKIHSIPRVVEEILTSVDTPKKSVVKCYRLLLMRILPQLKVRINNMDAMRYTEKFGEELKLPMPIRQNAISLIKKAKSKGLLVEGKDPKGLAAAAIYISATMNNLHKTQNEIAQLAHVTEVTLRMRYRDLQRYTRQEIRRPHQVNPIQGV